MTGPGRSRRAWWPVLLCAVLALTIGPADVAAHAKLVRASPAPNSMVRTAPAVVRAWFNEELDARRSAISVWDTAGRRVDDGRGGVDLEDMDRRALVARLRPLRAGRYTVRWTAVSADDGFVTRGVFRFTMSP